MSVPSYKIHTEPYFYDWAHTFDSCEILCLNVPWDATTSYGQGAAQGPGAILKASVQVDLFDKDLKSPHENGLGLLEAHPDIQKLNQEAGAAVQRYRESQEPTDLDKVNQLSAALNKLVYDQSLELLGQGKTVALIGGDHSTPRGLYQALNQTQPGWGMLHFDAHMDFRESYEGFNDSHASIMYNALLDCDNLQKLVQVGIRDYCQEEYEFGQNCGERVTTFFDADLKRALFEGQSWDSLCDKIVSELPQNVWISFDVDGLDPRFCPNTGTPVPGGQSFEEALYVVEKLVQSGRTVIGFDVVEVAPGLHDEWDANVGARLVYRLAGYSINADGEYFRDEPAILKN